MNELKQLEDTNLAELKSILRKAEICRQSHYTIYTSLILKSKILHSGILIGSCTVAILTFANFKTFKPIISSLTGEIFTLIVGLLASCVFILSVLEEYTNLKEKANQHEIISKQLTIFIRESHLLEKLSFLPEEKLSSVIKKYNTLNENMPNIPDKVFLRSKQALLKKVSVSRKLDEDPFINIKYFYKNKRK